MARMISEGSGLIYESPGLEVQGGMQPRAAIRRSMY